MSFDYRKEFAKFKNEWEKQEKIMRDDGMSKETIGEIYNLYFEQFKSDRNYALHKYDFAQLDDDKTSPDEKTKRQGMATHPKEFDEPFDALMQSDNEALLNGLKKLSPSELQIVTLYCDRRMELRQISAYLGQKYDATQKQFFRAKNKLKNLL